MRVHIKSWGIAMPGLPNAAAALPVLAGQVAYCAAPIVVAPPQLLPANERRRAPLAVRLAFAAAEDALVAAPNAAAQTATVFASADADTSIIHRIASALAERTRVVSPTDFHNCVHNAAAGYWSIAAGSQGASNSLSAEDGSFAAGLIEAATQCVVEQIPVLLVAFDVPPPPPLLAVRPIHEPAAVALLLEAEGEGAALQLQLAPQGPESPCADAALEQLRMANPAARALPLLQTLCGGRTGSVALPAAGHKLRVSLC